VWEFAQPCILMIEVYDSGTDGRKTRLAQAGQMKGGKRLAAKRSRPESSGCTYLGRIADP
jgi:hypothetical protein